MLKYFSGLPLVGMLYRSISRIAVSFYKSSGIRIHPIPVKVGKLYFLTGAGGRAIRSLLAIITPLLLTAGALLPYLDTRWGSLGQAAL